MAGSCISMQPQLCVPAPKAAEAIQFYKAAFGAEEVKRATCPKKKVDQEPTLLLCAELKLGHSSFIVCDQIEGALTTDFSFCLQTEDVEGAVSRAVEAGAVAEAEVEGGCCGVGSGKLKDPFGYTWTVCSPTKPCVPNAKA